MSKARKSKLTLLTTFVLALGAGLVVGMAAARRGAAAQMTPAAQPQQRGKLAVALNLAPQQQEQMKAIWSTVMQGTNDRRKALDKDRDDAINRLFTSQQKAEYDRIQAEYNAKSSDLKNDRQRHIDEAVEQTKKILNDAQRQKYEQMVKDRGGRGGHHGFGTGGGGQGRNGPTTKPAGPGPDGQNSGRPFGAPTSNKSSAPTSRPSGDPA
jgi:hypothetical protein